MSFYPRLLEKKEEDTATKNLKKLAKGVGKKTPTAKKVSYAPFITSTVTLSPDKDRINRVGPNRRSDIITKEEYDSFQNIKAKENLKNFLKTKKNISVDDLDTANVAYSEFWDYMFNKILSKGEFQKEKAPKVKEFKFDKIIDEKDVQMLLDFYKNNGKEEQFNKFLNNLSPGKDFVKYFSHHVNQYILPPLKNNNEQWKSDMIKYIASMHDIEEFTDPSFLKEQILNENTFIHALYDFHPALTGRNELLIAYLFEGSSIQGGSEDFDVILVNGEKYEIKDYITVEEKDGLIRLGDASGNKAKFPFYDDLIKSRNCAISLFEKYKDKLKLMLHADIYDLWEKMTIVTRTNEPYQNVLGAAIGSGEVGKEALNRIIGWHYFMEDFVNNKYKNAPVEIVDKLSELKYAQDPEKIKKDFDDSPEQYFKNVGKNVGVLAAMIVSRKDKIRICKAKDLKFVSISQSKFKFLEADKYNYTPSYRDKVYKKYKELKPNLSYADFFVLKQEEEHEESMQSRYKTGLERWEQEKIKAQQKSKTSKAFDKWLQQHPEPLPEGYYPRLNEIFTPEGDPVHDMGIGDKETMMIEKLDELAKKYGFKEISTKNFTPTPFEESSLLVSIKRWFNKNCRDGTYVDLCYKYDDPTEYWICVEDEYSEMNDPIKSLNDPVFTERWWKTLY
jgi:hypothetical protein